MLFASLSLRNRHPLPDTLKIFEGDHGRGVFGFRNQLFGDAVVHVPTKPGLSTREFLEMTFGAIGPTALKIGLEVIYLGSNGLDAVTGELFAGRINGNVLDPEIDADNSNRFYLRRLGSFDDDAEIELPPFENEVACPRIRLSRGSWYSQMTTGTFILPSRVKSETRSRPFQDMSL